MKSVRWGKWVLFLAALIIATTLFLRQRQPGILGRVVLKGIPPPEFAIKLDAASAKLRPNGLTTRHYLVSPDRGLANVFVSIKEVEGKEAFERPPVKRSWLRETSSPPPVVVEFRSAQLEPYVVGVRTGQSIWFQNTDSNMHNIHCVTRPGMGNREVNFGVTPGNRGEPWYKALYRWLSMKPPPPTGGIHHAFDTAEAFIRVKCDVHPWEFAYISVSDHPFFAVTDKDGSFRIRIVSRPIRHRSATSQSGGSYAGDCSQPRRAKTHYTYARSSEAPGRALI